MLDWRPEAGTLDERHESSGSKSYPGWKLSRGHALLQHLLLVFQESQGAVYFVVLVAVVLSPVEERGKADQNPAEAELKVSQDVDGEDHGKRLAEFNPHLGDVGQRGLRLLQLPRGQRWAEG